MKDIEDMINQFTTEAVKPRSEKSRVKNKVQNKKNNYQSKATKDPVLDWLESQPEIEEVYLDDMGLIVGSKLNEENVVYDIDSPRKLIVNAGDPIEEWLSEDNVIDIEIEED